MVIFLRVFLKSFKVLRKLGETFCTDFLNYSVEILWMKLLQENFGKAVVKLPVKY